MTTPQQRIAARMRQRREELGISQDEAGHRLGVTLRTYARWERGESHGYLTQLAAVAVALETTESELLGGEDAITARPTVDNLAAKLDELAHELRELREDLGPLINGGRMFQPDGASLG